MTIDGEVLWQSVSDGLVLVNPAGEIVRTNTVLDELFGYAPGSLVGQPIERLIPPEHAEAHRAHRAGYEQAPTGRTMGYGMLLNLQGLRQDRSTFPVDISLSAVGDPPNRLVLAAVRDVSEQRLAGEAVAEANRRRAVAEDHQRIARDLHDNVIQQVFAVGLDLQSLNYTITDPETRDRLDTAIEEIDLVIVKVREAIFGLSARPNKVDLRERLVSVAGVLSQALGFDPALRFDGPLQDVPDPMTPHLEAVVREALANVARHAEAGGATVSVEVDDRHVTVKVADDGRGMSAPPTRRSGLDNLADRADQMGGSFEFSSQPDTGTVVFWQAPLSPEADQTDPPAIDQSS